MTVLRQRMILHMRLGGGGFTYGYEILDAAGTFVGTKSVSRAKKGERLVTTLTLGEQQFATVEEFREAYAKQIEAERRDQEWEAHAPC